MKQQSKALPIVAVVISLGLLAILVIQAVKTGEVDKYLIGALVVLALAFSGYGGDRLLERWLERNKPR